MRLVLPFNEAASLLEELKRKHRTARARLLEALLEETVLSYDVITKKLHITGRCHQSNDAAGRYNGRRSADLP